MVTRKHKVQPFGMMILTGGIDSILARLFRVILRDLGVTSDRYDALMIRYIQRAQLDADRTTRATARIGLSKELLKESMTWKTLMKGFDFLNIVDFELDLWLTNAENVNTRHILPVVRNAYPNDGAILGSFFKQILDDKKLSSDDYQQLMDDYIEKFRPNASKKEKAAVRASLNKEFLKPTLSWKTFVKGLVFVQAAKFTLNVTLHHRNEKRTQHQVIVLLDDFTETEGDEDEA